MVLLQLFLDMENVENFNSHAVHIPVGVDQSCALPFVSALLLKQVSYLQFFQHYTFHTCAVLAILLFKMIPKQSVEVQGGCDVPYEQIPVVKKLHLGMCCWVGLSSTLMNQQYLLNKQKHTSTKVIKSLQESKTLIPPRSKTSVFTSQSLW
jgi:hypothetical protein